MSVLIPENLDSYIKRCEWYLQGRDHCLVEVHAVDVAIMKAALAVWHKANEESPVIRSSNVENVQRCQVCGVPI